MSGAPARPRRADFERNLKRIIEAATEVLAVDPTANMTEIAEAAGLVRATLYRHFPTREELLVAIFRDALVHTAAVIEQAGPTRGPAPDALARVIDALAVVGDRYRVISGGGIDVVGDPALLDLAYATFAPVTALVERGQGEGTLRGDMTPQWITAALVALINEAAQAVDRGDIERAEISAVVHRTLLEPLVV